MARRQIYVFWNGDHLREFKLSRRQYQRIAKSPCYLVAREQWDTDMTAHGAYVVTLPNPADGPAIECRVTRPAARWAATTQASFQVRPAA
jgi:hypothetical protein